MEDKRNKPWKTLKISRSHYYRLLSTQPQKCLIEDFIRWKELGIQESLWSHRYKYHTLRQIHHYFDAYPIIKPDAVAAWITEYSIEQLSARKDRHKALSMFSKFLRSRELLTADEYYRIRQMCPKKSRYYRPKQRIITTIEHDTILEVSKNNPELHRCLIVLSETALRIAECTNLKKGDLFFSDNALEAKLYVEYGKGGKARWVPFSKKCQAVIPNPYETFLSARTLSKLILKLSKKIDIPFSAHSFRHYRITQWANNPRIPITTTQKWAGHSTLAVTQNYIHITDNEAMLAVFGS